MEKEKKLKRKKERKNIREKIRRNSSEERNIEKEETNKKL